MEIAKPVFVTKSEFFGQNIPCFKLLKAYNAKVHLIVKNAKKIKKNVLQYELAVYMACELNELFVTLTYKVKSIVNFGFQHLSREILAWCKFQRFWQMAGNRYNKTRQFKGEEVWSTFDDLISLK